MEIDDADRLGGAEAGRMVTRRRHPRKRRDRGSRAVSAKREEQQRRLARRQAEESQSSSFASSDIAESSAPVGASGEDATRPSGPAVVSVRLRSSCSKTVKVFFGKTPKFGSGTTTPIGGNSVQSRQMKEGDMMWIVDDSGNGLASFTVSQGTREVEITSSCTSFSSR